MSSEDNIFPTGSVVFFDDNGKAYYPQNHCSTCTCGMPPMLLPSTIPYLNSQTISFKEEEE